MSADRTPGRWRGLWVVLCVAVAFATILVLAEFALRPERPAAPPPAGLAALFCRPSAAVPVPNVVLPGGWQALLLGPPARPDVPAILPGCLAAALGQELGADGLLPNPVAAELRARQVWGAALGFALVAGAGLVGYGLFGVIGRVHGPPFVLGVAVLSAALTVIARWLWLPHDLTLRTLEPILSIVPRSYGVAGSVSVWPVAWWELKIGVGLLSFVIALYVFALAALATAPATTATVLDDDATNLALRMRLLTNLSYGASVGLGLALLALYALMQWAQTVGVTAAVLPEAARTLQALLGAYLTAIMIAAYIPAAGALSAEADALARRAASEVPPPGDVAEAAAAEREALEQALPDPAPALAALRRAADRRGTARLRQEALRAMRERIERAHSGLLEALRGAPPAPPRDLAWRRAWMDQRGLSVLTPLRIGATLATFVPVIVGALATAAEASGAISRAFPP